VIRKIAPSRPSGLLFPPLAPPGARHTGRPPATMRPPAPGSRRSWPQATRSMPGPSPVQPSTALPSPAQCHPRRRQAQRSDPPGGFTQLGARLRGPKRSPCPSPRGNQVGQPGGAGQGREAALPGGEDVHLIAPARPRQPRSRARHTASGGPRRRSSLCQRSRCGVAGRPVTRVTTRERCGCTTRPRSDRPPVRRGSDRRTTRRPPAAPPPLGRSPRSHPRDCSDSEHLPFHMFGCRTGVRVFGQSGDILNNWYVRSYKVARLLLTAPAYGLQVRS